jgi:hypothetical protein
MSDAGSRAGVDGDRSGNYTCVSDGELRSIWRSFHICTGVDLRGDEENVGVASDDGEGTGVFAEPNRPTNMY